LVKVNFIFFLKIFLKKIFNWNLDFNVWNIKKYNKNNDLIKSLGITEIILIKNKLIFRGLIFSLIFAPSSEF